MLQKPSLWLGALVALCASAVLLVVVHLGHIAAGLPLLASDFFNPVRDAIPGDLIVFTIQRIVDVIIGLNLGRVDVVAKQVETAMATGLLLVVAALLGVAIFALFPRTARRQLLLAGALMGGAVGVLMALISLNWGITSTVNPALLGAVWIAALFIVWGVALAWSYEHLAYASGRKTSVESLDRRRFLITMGASTAAVTVVGAGLSALLQPREATIAPPPEGSAPSTTAVPDAELAALPNADDPVSPAPGTRPELTPLADHYRIDIAIVPPVIDGATWALPFVSSLDGAETELARFTLDEIKAYEATDAYITMSCISNRIAGDLISTIKWTGVSMQRLLADVPLPASATHLKIYSEDGFDETVALDVINNDPRVLLAYAWEDQPLTTEHGFPLRIHIPDLYGMKQPKWITRIEVLGADQDGYWVRRGWDKVARVQATAVIDTVAVDDRITVDGQELIPVGGIAWAGARGISAVEIRFDEGEWQPARVRAPLSDRTWVIWRYDWPFTEGQHTLAVRCIEADGTPQVETPAGVRPSGATGLHSVGERI